MIHGTIHFAYDPAVAPTVTHYAIFNSSGVVKVLTEEEARELAKTHPTIAALMGITPGAEAGES